MSRTNEHNINETSYGRAVITLFFNALIVYSNKAQYFIFIACTL